MEFGYCNFCLTALTKYNYRRGICIKCYYNKNQILIDLEKNIKINKNTKVLYSNGM